MKLFHVQLTFQLCMFCEIVVFIKVYIEQKIKFQKSNLNLKGPYSTKMHNV